MRRLGSKNGGSAMQGSRKSRVLAGALALATIVAAFGLGPSPAGALSGGPDAFGYVFTDSAEPGGPAFNFEDISGTGIPVFLGDDQVSGAVPIGFSFSFYGSTYPTAYVSSNGFVTFSAFQSSGCCSGAPIPSTGSPNNLVSGYWADLYPPGGGSIKYQTLGTAPNQRFIVQFTGIPHYCCSSFPVTMQFKLFEGSGDIEVHYQSAPNNGATHSAGIEDAAGTIGLQYCRPCSSLANIAVRYYLGAPPPNVPTVTGPNETLLGVPVTLEATSTDPGGNDVAYLFDWKDGSPVERVPAAGFVPSGTSQQATRAYTTAGQYNVEVRAENTIGGTSAAAIHTIEAPPPPVAPTVTGPTTVVVGNPITLEAVSTDPNNFQLAYNFDWGDFTGTTRAPASGFVPSGVAQQATHTYSYTGYYPVSVTAESDQSRTSAATVYYVNVTPPPPPNPPVVSAPTTAVIGYPISLEATSTDPSGFDVAYWFYWDDGPPYSTRVPASGFVPSGTAQSIEHTFDTIGLHTVTVYAQNSYGLYSTPTDVSIEVIEPPTMMGRGAVALAEVPGTSPASLAVADTGEQSSQAPLSKQQNVVDASGPLAVGGALAGSVDLTQALAAPHYSEARSAASAADLTLTPPGGPVIDVRGLSVSASTTCAGSTGAATIGYLAVDGEVLVDGNVTPPANTVIPLGDGGSLILNEQTTTADSLTVAGVHVVVPGVGDVMLGYAASALEGCPGGAPPPPPGV